jgi:hypothetical protein
MAFMAGKKWIFPAVHDLHIELVVIRGVALQSVLGDDGTGNLLVVGLDKYAGFHGVTREVTSWLGWGSNYNGMHLIWLFWGPPFPRE